MKYSILIPVYNGAEYLPTCVATILNQRFEDFELIISNDHSTDNTEDYLKTINHPNIKILHPSESMSMAEHWEWMLAHASGEWIMFVGQDDGLQPYFFKLAEYLTLFATKKNIRTITSQRAYFFWPGCEARYGDTAISYRAIRERKVNNSLFQTLITLLGFQTYFELPQMYTTSLFHKGLLAEVKEKQNGKIFVTHPQDANLAALACSMDSRFLKSGIPLGWVGSSPKSAGMSIRLDSTNYTDLESLKENYLQKIDNSRLTLHPLTGDFTLGSLTIYYWGALLQTQYLRKLWVNKLINTKFFITLMLSGVLSKKDLSNKRFDQNQLKMFFHLVKLNKCNPSIVILISHFFTVVYALFNLYSKVVTRTKRTVLPSFKYAANWKENSNSNMIIVSNKINEGIHAKRILNEF